uniref:Beta_elim_lyase domain-containing protein n=1 Tax=Globodera pallida TaxID=36090 RepID=A0A183C2T9_GLOPA
MINLTSDNWSGAHPKISEALLRHCDGGATAYGASVLDKKIERTFNEIFESDVAVYFVGTGTAANALSMAYLNRAGGIIFAHRHAHLIEDECGAPEYFTGGARLVGVGGAEGRIDPEALESAIRRYDPADPDSVHAGPSNGRVRHAEHGKRHTLLIGTNPSHCEHCARARHSPAHGWGTVHKCTEMSWKSGVDILSFGASKNGCWCAEAILVFNDLQKAHKDFPYLRKRAAHLFSKTRFIAAQFEAYFADGLWLKNARHANEMASRLASFVLSMDSKSVRLAWTPQANEVFVVMRRSVADGLRSIGRISPFYEWAHGSGDVRDSLGTEEALYRLVTTFATTAEEIDEFGTLLEKQCLEAAQLS